MYVDIWHWKDSAIEAWRAAYLHMLQRMFSVGGEVGMNEDRKAELLYAIECARNDAHPKTEGRMRCEVVTSTYVDRRGHEAANTARIEFSFEMRTHHEDDDRDKPITHYPIEFRVRANGGSGENPSDAIGQGKALVRLGELALELEAYIASLGLNNGSRVDEAKVAAQEARSNVYWPINRLPSKEKELLMAVFAAYAKAAPDLGLVSFSHAFNAKERKLLKDLTKWIKVTHVRKSKDNPDGVSTVKLTKVAKQYLTYEAEKSKAA